MNKYRISNHLDYYTELTCLKCKKISIYDYNSDREVYNYCPFCGTKWDGVFDTVNKRYSILSAGYTLIEIWESEWAEIKKRQLSD